MKTLSSLPQTTPHSPLSKTSPRLLTPTTIPAAPLHKQPQTWRLHGRAKGFSSSTTTRRNKDREPPPTPKRPIDSDDKIPDVVWERMIKRILFYVGVPLGIGFVLLYGENLLQEQGVWNVPKWVPYLTTLITFGTSALGIAFGSLSTSLDAEEKGSFLGFEQVEKNWNEMWQEEEEEDAG